MRILILQRFDLSSVSCARRVICQTLELRKRGHDVILSDFPHPERQREVPSVMDLQQSGVEVLPLERKVGGYLRNLLRLKKLSPKPDIIHLWKSYPDASLPAYLLSRYWNVPLHYDWDDWEAGIAAELTGSRLAGWVAGRWDRNFPRYCATLTAASGFLRKKAVEYGFPEDRIWDAPVGADLEQFYPRPKDEELAARLQLNGPVMIYIGQLEVASYAEQAVDVLKTVKRDLHTAKLLVVGGGRKLEQIKTRAKELNLEHHVLFTDYVPAADIPRYLSLADLCLAPFEENNVTRAKSPLKIAEYLAMGKPILASDVGDVQKMILGAGVAVPCGNTAEMAKQAHWILTHPGIQSSMSAAGRKTAENIYNWKTHTDTLLHAYDHALR